MGAFIVHAADAVQAVRFNVARYSKHRLSMPLATIQFLGSIWLILRIVEVVNSIDAPLAMPITPGSLLFAAFMIALGKGAIDGYNRMVRNPSLVFSLNQPVTRRSIVAAKLLTVYSFNMGFVALALGTATAMIAALGMNIPDTGLFLPSLVISVAAGLASGFAMSVAASLSTWRRKITGLAALATIPAISWVVMIQNEPPMGSMFAYLLSMLPIAVAGSLATAEWLLEAWNMQTSSPAKSGVRVSRTFRLPWMTDPEAAIFDKEFKTAWRKREIAISFATLGLLSATLASVPFLLGEPPSGALARFVIPAMALAGAWIGSALVLTSKGLSSIGGEFDSVWILRTAPVDGHTVAVGKVGVQVLVVPVVVAASLPIAFLAGLSATTILLVALAALSVGFLMTTVGLYFGARSPSFDRNSGGLPDSFSMYAIFVLGLIACAIFISPAAAMFLQEKALGLLTAIMVADISALMLLGATRSAGRRIDALET